MRQRLVVSIFLVSLLHCSAYAGQCTTTPKLAFGNAHAVVLTDDCSVWVWGLNDYGELGNAKLKASAEPIQVTPLRDVIDVAASSDYSLALLSDGRVVIWGNFDTCCLVTTPLSGSRGWSLRVVSGASQGLALAAASRHFLVLRKDGTILEFSPNEQDNHFVTPVLPKVVAISTGSRGSLAIDASGGVWAWSAIPHQDGSADQPKQVAGLPVAHAVAAALWHSMALDAQGNVWVWGSNKHGQLGIPNSGSLETPTRLPSISNIISIDATYDRSVALGANGQVYGWGGRWTIGASPIPMERSGLHNIKRAFAGGNSAGNYGTYAIGDDGTLLVWRGSTISGDGYAKGPDAVSPVMFRNGAKPFNVCKQGKSNSTVEHDERKSGARGSP